MARETFEAWDALINAQDIEKAAEYVAESVVMETPKGNKEGIEAWKFEMKKIGAGAPHWTNHRLGVSENTIVSDGIKKRMMITIKLKRILTIENGKFTKIFISKA